jgi:hypothetical protein
VTDACSIGLSATNQQYFFSQNKPATSNQPIVFFSQNKSASAISYQPNERAEDDDAYIARAEGSAARLSAAPVNTRKDERARAGVPSQHFGRTYALVTFVTGRCFGCFRFAYPGSPS